MTKEERAEANKKLIEEFPFLQVNEDNYFVTWLDFMPEGWKNNFGLSLCNDLKEQLLDDGDLGEFEILDVKEKWGMLDMFVMNASERVYGILDKYQRLSQTICCGCGKPATKISKGWISPWCDDCAKRIGGAFSEIK